MGELKNLLYERDLKWIFFFNSKLKCRFLDRVLPVVTYIGSAAVTVSICFLMIGLGSNSTRHIGFEAMLSLVLSHTIVQALKRNVCRKRPNEVLLKINTFKVPIDLYSFPSGHTTAVFAIAATISIQIPILAFLVLPIAFIVGLSRLYVGVHYPTDVIVGIFIAVVTSTVLQMMLK
jgi:undecaprenyl-diphosphatase